MPKSNDPLNPDNAPNPPVTPARAKDAGSALPPDADVEERFNDFWQKNGGAIFAGIGIAAVIVLGVMTVRWWQERQEANVRAAFSVAQETHELEEFAKDNDDHPLGGLAMIELANRQYEEGNYAAAAETYSKAAKTLGDSPAGGRARLGAAMAKLFGANPSQGEEALRQLVLSAGNTDQLRAQAGFNLALHYWQQGKLDAMREIIDSVEGLTDGGIYQMQSLQLRNRLPEQ